MLIHRRKFLAGIGSMLAAPAIVHYGNLMPVKAIAIEDLTEASFLRESEDFIKEIGCSHKFYIGINQTVTYRWVASPGSEIVYPTIR